MIGAMLLLNMNGVNAIEIKSNEKNDYLSDFIDSNKIDVRSELEKTIEEYRNDILATNDKEEISKLNNLILACKKTYKQLFKSA